MWQMPLMYIDIRLFRRSLQLMKRSKFRNGRALKTKITDTKQEQYILEILPGELVIKSTISGNTVHIWLMQSFFLVNGTKAH